MGKYMTRFVGQRRASLAEQDFNAESEGTAHNADLFARLVAANEKEGKLVLDDTELVCATN